MEELKRLISYKEEIKVLSLTMNVPKYEGERKSWFPTYAETLLRLFNNKRENKEILEIVNYYNSNKITMRVNLTAYGDTEQDIEHLKEWFKGSHDISNDEIECTTYKGYIYSVDTFDSNIQYEDQNGDYIMNFIEWAE